MSEIKEFTSGGGGIVSFTMRGVADQSGTLHAAPEETEEFTCHQCKQRQTAVHGFFKGYGELREAESGQKLLICLECSAKVDEDFLDQRGQGILYPVKKNDELVLSNFNGTRTYKIIHRIIRDHNWYGNKQIYYQFVGPFGKSWHGRSIDGRMTGECIVRCKKNR